MMVIFRPRTSDAVRWAAITGIVRCRSRLDLSKFEQFETERLDLLEDAEQRGSILDQTREHGLAAFQLRHHRGKGRQGGCSEPAPYPDRVQAWRCGHAIILQPDRVSRRHRNLVIVRTPVLALFRRCSGAPGCEEPQFPGALNGGRAIARTELGIDVADVRVDGVDGDVELSRDLGPRQVRRQISQDA